MTHELPYLTWHGVVGVVGAVHVSEEGPRVSERGAAGHVGPGHAVARPVHVVHHVRLPGPRHRGRGVVQTCHNMPSNIYKAADDETSLIL